MLAHDIQSGLFEGKDSWFKNFLIGLEKTDFD